MSVELPKDAEGREIPLDTVALYDDDGNVHSVRRFIYTTDFDLSDKWINSWIAVVDDYKVAKPELMYLTPPDSWEKLEEDLDSCSASTWYTPCVYFNKSNYDCEKCLADPNKECIVQMTKHIALRVHNLRGES